MVLLLLAALLQVTHLRYPLPIYTPGDILPWADKSTVCTSGYTSKVRHVSEKTKKTVFKEYGIVYQPDAYEIDHFISLELGGSNDIKNLWPESYPEASQKDLVENYLHNEVCHNRMTLAAAQNVIRTDWYRVYLELQQRKVQ